MAAASEIITHFQFLVDDDNISQTRALVLINMGLQRLATLRPWNFLKAKDTTHTIATATTAYALPTDMLFLPNEKSVYVVKSDGSNTQIKMVDFSRHLEYTNVGGYAYIDKANGNLVFTASDLGDLAGGTLTFLYIKEPVDLEITATPTDTSPTFAKAFHYILSYYTAKHFWYNDQVEKSRSWNKEMEQEYQMIFGEMVTWDENLMHSSDPTFQPLEGWLTLDY